MNRFAWLTFLTAASLACVASPYPISAIDFARQPNLLYVSLQEVAGELGVPCVASGRELSLNGTPVKGVRRLFDGTAIIPIRDLRDCGATIAWDQVSQTATVQFQGKTVLIHRGAKRAIVNKRVQELRAYQGGILVLQTHVSTGRMGHRTPSGLFVASYKERLHLSKLYDNAPMPWAVHVDGNIFIHGFTSVPRRPASHGCVRMPLYGKNPARYFWLWISVGTPVAIGDSWTLPASSTPAAGPVQKSSALQPSIGQNTSVFH